MSVSIGDRAYVPHLRESDYSKATADVTHRDLTGGFIDDTTSHGLPQIVKSKGIIKTTLWILLTLGGYAGWIYHTYSLIYIYMQYSTSVSITVKSARNLTFPAVTVCNLNPLKHSLVDSTVLGTANQTASEVYNPDDPFLTNNPDEYGNKSRDYQVADDIYWYVSGLTHSVRQQWGYSMHDFILSCQFRGYECKDSSFTEIYNWQHGNCFIFNAGSNVIQRKAVNTGPRYGLRLYLNIEQSEYIGELAPKAGARILIHSPTEMPFPEEQGELLRPGTATEIGLRMVALKRLGGVYSSCIDTTKAQTSVNMYEEHYNWTRFSLKACQKTCYQRYLMKTCLCYDSRYPSTGAALDIKSHSLTACKQRNYTQALCQFNVETMYNNGTVPCNCLDQPCSEVYYQSTITSALWPSENYKSTELDLLAAQSTGAQAIVNAGGDEYAKNFIVVDVFYEELNYEYMAENADYELGQFLSDLGGCVGLWIGASILTIFEFFELGIDALVLAVWKSMNRSVRAGRTQVQPNETSRTKPMFSEDFNRTKSTLDDYT